MDSNSGRGRERKRKRTLAWIRALVLILVLCLWMWLWLWLWFWLLVWCRSCFFLVGVVVSTEARIAAVLSIQFDSCAETAFLVWGSNKCLVSLSLKPPCFELGRRVSVRPMLLVWVFGLSLSLVQASVGFVSSRLRHFVLWSSMWMVEGVLEVQQLLSPQWRGASDNFEKESVEDL